MEIDQKFLESLPNKTSLRLRHLPMRLAANGVNNPDLMKRIVSVATDACRRHKQLLDEIAGADKSEIFTESHRSFLKEQAVDSFKTNLKGHRDLAVTLLDGDIAELQGRRKNDSKKSEIQELQDSLERHRIYDKIKDKRPLRIEQILRAAIDEQDEQTFLAITEVRGPMRLLDPDVVKQYYDKWLLTCFPLESEGIQQFKRGKEILCEFLDSVEREEN